MTRRGYGRATWTAPASCPPETADAVHRLVDLWADRIERPRLRPHADTSRPCANPVRFDHTTRRCRSVAAVLRGLAGRQQVTEAELADAIEGYAASPWHRKQRAWRTLSDWLAPEREDELLRWVVDGRVARQRRALAESAAEARGRAQADRRAEATHAANLAVAAEAQLARLEAIESDRLVALEAECLAGLAGASRGAIWAAAGRPPALTTRNCRALRGLVLRRLAAEIEQADAAGAGAEATGT